jgi:NADH-quinone oxidoreductase subunit G
MPQVTIDGLAVDFSAGESVIQAAVRQKIDIPYYCWHPRLSVAANCRMCLVEVEKAPKLVPACQTECKEGMVVHTTNAKVKDAQRAVHEFLLVNHPIDCPICDQAGECKLQDYYMKFQLVPSRMADQKVRKRKRVPLGPYVVYDAERCIVCTRCVRFMEEVPKQRQLGVFNRGDHSVIGIYPGQPLDSAYSLNTVDICPVGALTSTAFRFKQRVWNLRRSPSVCAGCARGCNVHVDHRSAQVYRLLPRENEAVNKSWLCDEGRLTYSRATENRLDAAVVHPTMGPRVAALSTSAASRAAEADPSSPIPSMPVPPPPMTRSRAACQVGGELLTAAQASGKPLAAAISLHATCEEAYVFGRFCKEVLEIESVALLEYAPGTADAVLRLADKNPNRRGVVQVLHDLQLRIDSPQDLLRSLEQQDVSGLLCVGHEGEELAELAAAAGSLGAFVHLAHASSPLSEVAQITLPSACWVQTQGTWINEEGRLQHLTPAYGSQKEARMHSTWLMLLAADMGKKLEFPSIMAVQAEMRLGLPSFSQVRLEQLPATGALLAAAAGG